MVLPDPPARGQTDGVAFEGAGVGADPVDAGELLTAVEGTLGRGVLRGVGDWLVVFVVLLLSLAPALAGPGPLLRFGAMSEDAWLAGGDARLKTANMAA